MKKIETILLDFDNTILDSKGAYDYSLKILGDFWFSKFQNKKFKEDFEFNKMKNRERLGHLPYHRNRILVLKAMLDEIYGYPDFSLLLEMDKIYFDSFLEYIENWRSQNPVDKLLSYIEKFSKSKKIILITNESLRTQLIKAGKLFPKGFPINMLTSEEVGIEKPNPDYFQYVCKVHSIDPNKSLVVGDSLQDDIRGAVNYGITAFHVKSIFGGTGFREKSLDGKSYFEFESTLGVFHYIEAYHLND